MYVTAINAVARFAAFMILYGVLQKAVKVKIPWKSIGKYVAASLVMALVLFFAHPVRRSSTLLITGVGALIYILLLMAIDKETRTLVRTVLRIVGKGMNRLRKSPSPG
jgi:hypothetical protein